MGKQNTLDNPGIFAQVRMTADGTTIMPYDIFAQLPRENIIKTLEQSAKEQERRRQLRIREHNEARERNRRKRK